MVNYSYLQSQLHSFHILPITAHPSHHSHLTTHILWLVVSQLANILTIQQLSWVYMVTILVNRGNGQRGTSLLNQAFLRKTCHIDHRHLTSRLRISTRKQKYGSCIIVQSKIHEPCINFETSNLPFHQIHYQTLHQINEVANNFFLKIQ